LSRGQRWFRHCEGLPLVMRVETPVGEATLLFRDGFVEHASPQMAWALGLWVGTLTMRLSDRGWVFVSRKEMGDVGV